MRMQQMIGTISKDVLAYLSIFVVQFQSDVSVARGLYLLFRSLHEMNIPAVFDMNEIANAMVLFDYVSLDLPRLSWLVSDSEHLVIDNIGLCCLQCLTLPIFCYGSDWNLLRKQLEKCDNGSCACGQNRTGIMPCPSPCCSSLICLWCLLLSREEPLVCQRCEMFQSDSHERYLEVIVEFGACVSFPSRLVMRFV